MKVPLIRQIAELKRELKYRKNLYPRWVQNRNMTKEQADYQISALEAAIETLEGLKPPPQGTQQDLF